MDKLFEISDLRCSYDKPYREGVSKVVLVIDHLTLPRGKIIFIVGESGIGKSTILETLGMMNNTIVPDDESKFLFYDDGSTPIDLIGLWKHNDDNALSDFRRRHFNFIFQSTNLMRNFTAYENISITRMLQGYSMESSFQKAESVLKDLGLEHVDRSRMAQELSGGQQQRLAFARAILPDFTVLFGDEPTGNLDSDNAVNAMRLLTAKLDEMKGSSAVIVSHDMHLAVTFADSIIKIHRHDNPVDKHGEITSNGVINDLSVFNPDADKKTWTNGAETYPASEFEQYLKRA